MRASRSFGAIARGCVLVLVAATPWAFGSVEPWAYLLMCVVADLAVVAWGLKIATRSHARIFGTGAGIPLIMLLVLVLVQTLPLPRALARRAGASMEDAYVKADGVEAAIETGIVSETVPPSNARESRTLSICPFATRRGLLVAGACVAAFFIVANNLRTWSHADALCGTLIVTAFLIAVFGLVQKFSGTDKLFWYRTPRFGGVIFGPFVNRNHFAGYMTLAVGITLGHLLATVRPGSRTAHRSWKRKVLALGRGRLNRMLFIAFAIVVMGAAVCVSMSRAGIITLFASLGFVVALLAAARSGGKRRNVVAAIALLVLAAVVWLGWHPVLERFQTLGEIGTGPFSDARLNVWRDSLNIVRHAPLLGTGLGTFRYIYPMFKTVEVPEAFFFAHNDYIQLLSEVGIVGASLAALVIVFFAARNWRAFRRCRSASAVGLAAGAAGGCFAMILHSIVDFNLHIPSNALLFAVAAGIVVAAIRLPERQGSSRRRNRRPSASDSLPSGGSARDGVVNSWRMRPMARVIVSVVLIATGAGALALATRSFRTEIAVARLLADCKALALEREIPDAEATRAAILSRARDALRLEGDHVEALEDLSSFFLGVAGRTSEPIDRLRFADATLWTARQAVRAAPTSYVSWAYLARSLEMLGLGVQSEFCYARAEELAPCDARLAGGFGLYAER